MKRALISIAAAVGFSILPSTAAFAQSTANPTSVYQVPFSFNVAGASFEPGRYVVSVEYPGYIVLTGSGHTVTLLRRPQLEAKAAPAHLMFSRHGSSYFLHEVWETGKNGSTVQMSNQEREIMRSEQRAKATPSNVVLTASR